MPRTRSQKDVPHGVSTRSSEETTTEESSGRTTEGTTSGTTSGTNTTETTETMTSTAATGSMSAATKDRRDKEKEPEEKGRTARSAGSIKSIASVKTTRPKSTTSTARRKELEAQEELARLELERAQAATKLAHIRLEMVQAEEDDDDEIIEDPEDKEAQVRNWIQSSAVNERNKSHENHRGLVSFRKDRLEEEQPAAPTKNTIEIQTLAEALKQAFGSQENAAMQPKYVYELPYFEGNSSEWIAFSVVYEDTAPSFSKAQNMARLRRSIKGAAREAFKSLLFSEAPPEEVMQALRRRYGRPDALVLAELEKVKALPKISDNPRDICVFASQVNNSVAAIRGLKKPLYLHSPEMVKQVVEKLPSILRFRWYDFIDRVGEDDFADLTLIAKFLNKEADKCGAFAVEERTYKRLPHRQSTHAACEQEARIPTPIKKEKTCLHCKGQHHMFECQRFAKLPIDERWEEVKKKQLCFKCLFTKHRKEVCKRPPCRICKRMHHTLLHSERAKTDETNLREEQLANMEVEAATSTTSQVNLVRAEKAYLKIAPVEVYGPKGSKQVLALLDEGSTVTLMDSQLAEQIGVTGVKEELILETVGGKTIQKKDSQRVKLKIKGIHQDTRRTLDRVRTVDDLKLTPQVLNKEKIEKCQHLKTIANILYYDSKPPQILIGQDNWELIVSQHTKRGKPGQPVASLTGLGWVLHGYERKSRPVHFLDSCMHVTTIEEEMHETIKKHFSIEALGVLPRRPTTDSEQRAMVILEKTCRRLPDGRFEAGLLWKSETEQMPESYTQAEKRLVNIEKKLEKNPLLKEEYNQQIRHLISSGYAEEANKEIKSNRLWYLPHFSVVHPLKKKVRIVFDAAAKSRGKSLNDALLSGPDLLQSLFGVLLRFRQGPYAVAADIKEMFLQIRVRQEDRDSLRFLWREDTQEIKEYRMRSVVFGATSSPSMAIYVKNKNAAEFETRHAEAVKAIEKNHYMDDYLQSFHSEELLQKITKEVDMIHRKAKFELRKWASNRPKLLIPLSKEENATEVELGANEEKTLGLRWFTDSDKIGFRAGLRNAPAEIVQDLRIPTKREVTSAVMSTFDPLGLATPVLIQGKKLLQSIWRSGVGWDEKIEERDIVDWKTYVASLDILRELHIPRCIAPSHTEGEIHTFTDASETAYAAAVYWRTLEPDGSHLVHLVAGKARVTPIKPVSVPRLELQAALLGSRLAQSIIEELELTVTRKIYWTDSSVILSWIKTDPRTFKTFVAHRLAEMEDLTKPQEWRWVPTAQNPSDDATRNIPENFSNTHRWFTGPAFLRQDETAWPEQKNFNRSKTGEEKELNVVATLRLHKGEALPDPGRFSSWKKLWRATARVLQFIELCKTKARINTTRIQENRDPTWRAQQRAVPEIKRKRERTNQVETSYLHIEEPLLQQAEILLFNKSQEESFGGDIMRLQQGKLLEKASTLRKLDVKLQNGTLRLQGRINNVRGFTEEFKNPVVLHGKNRITILIIEDYHKRFNHGNHATVMNELRQRFMIIGLRAAVRSIQHKCQWCRMRKAKPQNIPTGDLPVERLQYGAHPFSSAAVDYFGPMSVTIGRRREKRWGALFTCLTTRAVHVELVVSLSTDSMILALRRFAARRGMPRTLYSDNGTNFVGANRELKEALTAMDTTVLMGKAEDIGIHWKFIPPGAPNMGGAWERMVRSIKNALEVTLKEKHPKEEILHTLLLEAEHIVNSRPLTYTVDNPDEEALTPNHFLIGRSCGAAKIGSFSDHELVGKETWKTVQILADHFWRRWIREYLPTLLPRKINGERTPRDLKKDDVVLIVDSTLPRCVWPRGRITQTYPGPDGRTRIVEVSTRGGLLRRPSSKIVLLVPDRSSNQEDGARHEGEDVDDQRPPYCQQITSISL